MQSSGGELYLIDDGGVIIDQYGPQYADLDLPIVDGLVIGSSKTDPFRAELAARVIPSPRRVAPVGWPRKP